MKPKYTVEDFKINWGMYGAVSYELYITGGVTVKKSRFGNITVSFPQATEPIPGCPWWRAIFKPGSVFKLSPQAFERDFDKLFVQLCQLGFYACELMDSPG